jgi:hypothetical protein
MVVRRAGETTNKFWWENLSENSHLDYKTDKTNIIAGKYLREWRWNCIRIKADGLTAVINNRLLVPEAADPSGRAV